MCQEILGLLFMVTCLSGHKEGSSEETPAALTVNKSRSALSSLTGLKPGLVYLCTDIWCHWFTVKVSTAYT